MGVSLIIGKAFSSFKRRPLAQIAATGVIFLQITIFTLGLFFYHNLRQTTEILGQELSLTVFLKEGLSQQEVEHLAEEILSWPEVASVRYISPEEAFERLKQAFSQNPELISGLVPDFLPPSLEIYFWKPFDLQDKLPQMAKTLSGYPQVDEVRYAGDWLARLQGFSDLIRTALLLVATILLLTVSVVVANVIRINIHSRAQELEILRLLGASRGLLRGPFLLEAFFQALLASLLALATVYLIFIRLQESVPSNIFGHPFRLQYLPWPWLAGIVGGVILVSLLASFLSLRQFLIQ